VDHARFDALARSLSATASRRRLGALSVGLGILTALGLHEDALGGKKKKKGKGKKGTGNKKECPAVRDCPGRCCPLGTYCTLGSNRICCDEQKYCQDKCCTGDQRCFYLREGGTDCAAPMPCSNVWGDHWECRAGKDFCTEGSNGGTSTAVGCCPIERKCGEKGCCWGNQVCDVDVCV
jgi:hypothetical protein